MVARCAEGVWSGAWRVHGWCVEGYRIFARYVEGPMEWLLGVWMVCKGSMDDVQRGSRGVQRVCRGCVEGV